MKNFFLKHSLALITTLGIGVALYTILNWYVMPVTQRMVGLFFFAVTLHEWEELKFPGGFTEMVMKNIKLPAMDMGIPKILLVILTLYLGFVPMLFPQVAWMAAAPLILGVIEVFAHLMATRMNQEKKFYSPGMITSLVIMLPVTVYGFYFLVNNNLMSLQYWLFAFLYLVVPLVAIQRFVVRMSGMKYIDFLKNARSALFGKNR
jgi:hypothetical protein